MTPMTIHLLGRFDVQLNGAPVMAFRSTKARALLAYLAVEANRPVPRTTLATLLWGDYPDTQARKSLRNTIAHLRKLLAPAVQNSSLLIDRQSVQLTTQAERCTVDVVRFDELVQTAQSVASALSRSDLLTRAAALYEGALLAGLPATDSPEFEQWRVLQQEARHRQIMDALRTLADSAIEQRDYRAAAEHARRQLELEPWQEQAHQQLMRILAEQGDRSGAHAQTGRARRVLKDELHVEPAEQTLALYEAIREGEMGGRKRGGQEEKNEGELSVVMPPLRQPVEAAAEMDRARVLSRLEPLPDQKLFGVETAKSRLLDVLQTRERPWLVAIDGIGGIGKTTLATALVHEFVGSEQLTDRFVDVAWISAKQEEFRPATGIAETGKPALTAESLTDGLLEQLLDRPPLTATPDEKRAALHNLLQQRPHLVVIDNLESAADSEALVPLLRGLANPSTFLLTTRHSLQADSDVFCYSLSELHEADALAFLYHEAEVRNLTRLNGASRTQLARICEVVGGNPLALKLVLGQVRVRSLAQVLDNLRAARGKRIDQLYFYIYWQAWAMLDETARQLFLAMPAVNDGTFDELLLASALDADDVQEALTRLMDLSLVQMGGDLNEPRYRLHRLTETFLMNEVLKWQTLR